MFGYILEDSYEKNYYFALIFMPATSYGGAYFLFCISL